MLDSSGTTSSSFCLRLLQALGQLEDQPHARAVEMVGGREVEHQPGRRVGDRVEQLLLHGPGIGEVHLAAQACEHRVAKRLEAPAPHSAAIPRPLELSDHPNLRALVRGRYHADRVHDRLHQAQSASAFVLPWLAPLAEVADCNGDLASRERREHLHRPIPGAVCVLDRVRGRLVAGEDDVEPLVVARLALPQPASKSAAKRGQRHGLGGQRELKALRRELDRAQGEQRDVVLPAGAERCEQAVAEALQVVVSAARVASEARQAVVDRRRDASRSARPCRAEASSRGRAGTRRRCTPSPAGPRSEATVPPRDTPWTHPASPRAAADGRRWRAAGGPMPGSKTRYTTVAITLRPYVKESLFRRSSAAAGGCASKA